MAVAKESRARPGLDGPTSAIGLLEGLVAPLAEALGAGTEVVLHDLSKVPNSIVAIGGKLTGRAIGGPTTDLLLRHLRQGRTEDMLRYRTQGPGGRLFCSSTLFLRDPAGQPFACLCINTDLTAWTQAHDLLGVFIAAVDPATLSRGTSEPSGDGGGVETFARTVEDLTVTTVRDAIARTGVAVELMQKHHKFEIVRELDEMGLFLIRDAVDYVADSLGVTRYTIYNYLGELKAASGSPTGPQRRATVRSLPLRSSPSV